MNNLDKKNFFIIHVAFGAALLILVIIFYFIFQSDRQQAISTRWLLHTHEVLTESERLASLIKDAQRSQRGYLLTHDTIYLQRYGRYSATTRQHLVQLKRLTADQKRQQLKLNEVAALTNKTLAYWDESIMLHQQSGEEASFALIRTGEGRELVNQIERTIGEFKQYEENLLQQRQLDFENSRRLFLLMEVAGACASLLLLSLSFVLLRSRLKREELLRNTLEDKVEQRTQELQTSNAELQNSLENMAIMNQQLQRTNTDLDNFVYTASHDLRSPIINLQGLLQLISKKLANRLDPKEQEIFERMTVSTTLLSRTIRDLAEVAKAQKEEHKKTLLSFQEIFQEVEQEIVQVQQLPDLTIETDFNVAFLQYAHSHLRSILYNLLSNAVKYRSPERAPFIRISTQQLHERTVLTVSDNGLGLDPDQVPKLFGMFKRLHTHVEGTGVGLYMIKRIVENNGGSINVDSQKGVGTTFIVVF